MEPTHATFKTFVNSEPGWKAWLTAALIAFRPYESGAASEGARQAARKILQMEDCNEMKKLYHRSALEFFPRTVAQANDDIFQDNAVRINKAYKLRMNGSCNRRNRKRTQEEPEEPKPEEPKPEEPKEEPKEEEPKEEQPKADKEETGSDKEEKPANFIEYNTLYTWVKTIVGAGISYYTAKQVSLDAPSGRPLKCPETPRHRVYDRNYDDKK
jgi:hypothetical protein